MTCCHMCQFLKHRYKWKSIRYNWPSLKLSTKLRDKSYDASQAVERLEGCEGAAQGSAKKCDATSLKENEAKKVEDMIKKVENGTDQATSERCRHVSQFHHDVMCWEMRVETFSLFCSSVFLRCSVTLYRPQVLLARCFVSKIAGRPPLDIQQTCLDFICWMKILAFIPKRYLGLDLGLIAANLCQTGEAGAERKTTAGFAGRLRWGIIWKVQETLNHSHVYNRICAHTSI